MSNHENVSISQEEIDRTIVAQLSRHKFNLFIMN